jgi:signal transduction histidine kinase/CheY-like chemotaxis protein
VLAGISCDAFAEFFKSVSLENHVSLSLSGEDGDLLAAWPLALGGIGSKTVTPPAKKDLAGDAAIIEISRSSIFSDQASSRPIVAVTRPIRNAPLYLNVSISGNGFIDGWLRAMRLLAGIASISLIGMIGAFWIMIGLLKQREKDAEQALLLKEKADHANEAKSSFLAMMSHEIRTPMNGILGLSELMLESSPDQTQRNYAQSVHSSAVELMRTINEVLDFSKIESGHMQIELTPFEPRQILQDVVALHRVTASSKQLHLDVVVGEDLPTLLSGDAAHLRQILGNLLNNAIKFTAAGSIVIKLSARPAPDRASHVQLLFSVKDSGIGIDKATQAALFQPFTQADCSISRKFGGTGLGLSICKGMVELMGGRIWCESEAGMGATFFVEVPCALAPAGINAEARSTAPADEQATEQAASTTGEALLRISESNSLAAIAPLTRSARILVAEDTKINLQLARMLLGKKGYQVDEAENGQVALAALQREHYDLVLMDCMMPVMDGFEATRQWRLSEAQHGRARTPVIALTASAIDGDRQRCLDAGMDDYLSKPFNAADFHTIVERWLTPPSSTQAKANC